MDARRKYAQTPSQPNVHHLKKRSLADYSDVIQKQGGGTSSQNLSSGGEQINLEKDINEGGDESAPEPTFFDNARNSGYRSVGNGGVSQSGCGIGGRNHHKNKGSTEKNSFASAINITSSQKQLDGG